MMKKVKQHIKKHNGFSLLEVLLVVILISITTLGISTIFNGWLQQSIDHKVAREMIRIQNIAEDYVNLNFDDVLATIPNNGNIVEIDIQDLKDDDFISDDYRAENSYRQNIKILARNVSIAGGDNIIEIISVGESPNGFDARASNGRLLRAAKSGSSKLGVVSALDTGPNCCENNIQNLHGLWEVSLADFNAFYVSDADIDNGGYIAAYGRVITNPIAYNDDYLYRVETGNAGSNRMNTNLDLNGNNIVGDGILTADNITVAGDVDIQGNTSNVLDLPYRFSVLEDLDIYGNMAINTNGDVSKGGLVIDGDNDPYSIDLNVNNRLRVQDGAGARGGFINAQNLNVSGNATINNSASFNNMAFGADASISTGDYSSPWVQSRAVTANNVSANTMFNISNMNAGNEIFSESLAASTLSVSRNTNVTNQVNMNGETHEISGTVNGQNRVHINNMTECGGGCTGYEGP